MTSSVAVVNTGGRKRPRVPAEVATSDTETCATAGSRKKPRDAADTNVGGGGGGGGDEVGGGDGGGDEVGGGDGGGDEVGGGGDDDENATGSADIKRGGGGGGCDKIADIKRGGVGGGRDQITEVKRGGGGGGGDQIAEVKRGGDQSTEGELATSARESAGNGSKDAATETVAAAASAHEEGEPVAATCAAAPLVPANIPGTAGFQRRREPDWTHVMPTKPMVTQRYESGQFRSTTADTDGAAADAENGPVRDPEKPAKTREEKAAAVREKYRLHMQRKRANILARQLDRDREKAASLAAATVAAVAAVLEEAKVATSADGSPETNVATGAATGEKAGAGVVVGTDVGTDVAAESEATEVEAATVTVVGTGGDGGDGGGGGGDGDEKREAPSPQPQPPPPPPPPALLLLPPKKRGRGRPPMTAEQRAANPCKTPEQVRARQRELQERRKKRKAHRGSVKVAAKPITRREIDADTTEQRERWGVYVMEDVRNLDDASVGVTDDLPRLLRDRLYRPSHDQSEHVKRRVSRNRQKVRDACERPTRVGPKDRRGMRACVGEMRPLLFVTRGFACRRDAVQFAWRLEHERFPDVVLRTAFGGEAERKRRAEVVSVVSAAAYCDAPSSRHASVLSAIAGMLQLPHWTKDALPMSHPWRAELPTLEFQWFCDDPARYGFDVQRVPGTYAVRHAFSCEVGVPRDDELNEDEEVDPDAEVWHGGEDAVVDGDGNGGGEDGDINGNGGEHKDVSDNEDVDGEGEPPPPPPPPPTLKPRQRASTPAAKKAAPTRATLLPPMPPGVVRPVSKLPSSAAAAAAAAAAALRVFAAAAGSPIASSSSPQNFPPPDLQSGIWAVAG